MQEAWATRQFRLLADGGEGTQSVLAVPEGVSYLAVAGSRLPRCAASWPRGRSAAWVLEPIDHGREMTLLALAPSGRPLQVNGERHAHVAGLRADDLFRLDGEAWTFQVAVYARSVIGRPPADYVGRACAICQRAIAGPETRIFICAACGAPLHSERGTGDDVLKCLDLCSCCPRCRSPLVRDGYLSLAEL